MPKPESLFRRRVDKFLDTLPFCKDFSIQQKTISGTPDKLICLCGIFVGLEIKTDEGVASPKQILALEDVLKAKGTALIVRPSNFEDIKEILRKISKGIRYDSNEIQGLAPPKTATSARKSGKYTNGPDTKLRSEQTSGKNSRGDCEDPEGKLRVVEEFREV